MDQHTYRLENGTCGFFNGPIAEAGETVTVQMNDENGNIIFQTGVIAEVLE